jgi:hypothetical protein
MFNDFPKLSYRNKYTLRSPETDRNSAEKMVLKESNFKTQSMSNYSEINYTPDDSAKNHFKFNCPIWFKHLTNIFVSSWCRNYYCKNCYHELKEDIINKGFTSAVRCIFWGKLPLRLELVNQAHPVKVYTDGPLRALQSKLSISEIFEYSVDRNIPNSFLVSGKFASIEFNIEDSLNVKNLSKSKAWVPVPFELTETDVDIPSEDEESIGKNINAINVSVCGNLKFNKHSQSNISTHESQFVSNYKTNSRDSKFNLTLSF